MTTNSIFLKIKQLEPHCIRLLKNSLQTLNGINQFNIGENSINIEFNPDLIDDSDIISVIVEIGCKVNMFYVRESDNSLFPLA